MDITFKEDKEMANLGDILTVPSAPAYAPAMGGDGLGGGLIGGLVLGSLLNRGGLGGSVTGDAAATAGVLAAIASNETLGQLADIKASVPLAEGQVQLALAQAVQQITSQNSANTNLLAQGQTTALLTAATNQALLARDIASVNTNVSATGAMVISAINADGNATRSLITNNQIAELNRIAAERQDEIIELRGDSRRDRDRHGIEINMINNQNQNQLQFQQQSQVLGSLTNCLADAVQSIRATNQAINIGSGVMAANPTNTNTNVRA